MRVDLLLEMTKRWSRKMAIDVNIPCKIKGNAERERYVWAHMFMLLYVVLYIGK